MFTLFRNMSIVRKGLRSKTVVVFSLVSVIPLLICIWIVVTYIFPNINMFFGLSLGNISFILFICIFISLLGFHIAKEMIDPVIKIAGDARVIANGDLNRIIEITREDEIGDLSKSLNIMTQKIKENMEELKTYSERTKMINLEINKKVLVLSSLLQIGNLISSSSELMDILNFTIQKVADVENNPVVFLMLMDESAKEFKVVSRANMDKPLSIKPDEVLPHIVIRDKKNSARTGLLNRMLTELELKNMIIIPIHIAGKIYGVFGLGNRDDNFIFVDDEKEILKVFVKQISIAIENDILFKRTKELAINDELTGLYNKKYIESRLNEEIKRALIYQRPCAYLLIDIDDFKNFYAVYGDSKAELLLKAIGDILRSAVREIDMVSRLGDDRFAIVMPERNKRQAADISEEIRKKVEEDIVKIVKIDKKVTVSIGVSENPIDGATAVELMDKADRLVRNAKSLGKNKVAV